MVIAEVICCEIFMFCVKITLLIINTHSFRLIMLSLTNISLNWRWQAKEDSPSQNLKRTILSPQTHSSWRRNISSMTKFKITISWVRMWKQSTAKGPRSFPVYCRHLETSWMASDPRTSTPCICFLSLSIWTSKTILIRHLRPSSPFWSKYHLRTRYFH